MSESPVTGGKIGLYIDRCLCLRIENLTIYGAPATASTSLRSVGVRIDSSTSATGTSAIQFQNCAFLYCTTCVETSNSSNNSELSFYDCMFALSHTGFKPGAGQAVVNRFIGCVGSGGDATNTNMTTMFDLGSGGNVTVIGFGGGNMSTFVEVGPAGKNVGWNIFENVRLEARGVWGQDNRIKIYNAVLFETAEGGSQRTEFRGLVIVPPALGEDDNGIERFSLLAGHEVVVWNASRTAQPLATPTSKLLEFIGSPVAPEQQGGLFRCYNLDIPQDSRLDRDTVPAKGRYSFQDCHTDLVPYPDKLNPPLYGPNYLMKVESHCWAVGDALNGVNAAMSATGAAVVSVSPSDAFRAGVISCKTTGNGHAALISHDQAIEPGGATWRFQASARVTALPTSEGNEFSVRLGFGNTASGEPTQGAYFRYRNEFNDNQWEGVLAWGSNTNVVDLKVTKDQNWHTFEIEVDATGGNARFYIDGVHRGTASAVITVRGRPGSSRFSSSEPAGRAIWRPRSITTSMRFVRRPLARCTQSDEDRSHEHPAIDDDRSDRLHAHRLGRERRSRAFNMACVERSDREP